MVSRGMNRLRGMRRQKWCCGRCVQTCLDWMATTSKPPVRGVGSLDYTTRQYRTQSFKWW